MLLTRDQILGASDLRYEDVDVPEWGGMVRVRGLTGAERDRFEASITEQQGKRIKMNTANIRARLVAMAAVDEAGKPLFVERDVAALGSKCASALDRLFDAARRLSGLSDGDVEELEKNSAGGQSGDSISV